MFKIEGNVVVNTRGDVMAEKIYGKWESKEQHVLDWIKAQEAPAKVKKPEVQEEEEEPKQKETVVSKIKKKVTKKA